uniref:Rho family-interacting cell polarization regulator 2 n=1 Tax=Cyprinodon variegatus TaxID=28743 RepID=A0A3Q2DQS3_CYPVA
MAVTDIPEDDLDEMMREEAEDVFYEDGVSSRVPEIMAAGTHSPGGPNGIIRSQSFAGFSTLQERRSRCNSFIGNSAVPKKPQSKPKKPHLSGHKGGSSSREPQPKRLEEVYTALKQGLDEYLEVHQTELDKLTSLMKDMKRNSRLQIKSIERYMRRLEFHISKVDELYEAFCIQSRLRDGAIRMKQAFSSSPSTKATKESISEVNRRYKEYTENMSAFESELENLLGEFHIKMKGLAGFARLCPGDQYEIFMRYGRQRWKLKGRIEVNSRQSWDGDEMVFMPLITDLINIKVTELKGLATHMLVGSVICETKELFTARPQVVAVDVNDLGTIKLNLEVTWYPFDVEDLTLSSGNLSKAAALQRRVSVYSQGTPETPTFQDSSFFKWQPYPVERQRLSFLHMLRETLLEKLRRSRSFGDLASLRPRPRSSLEVYSTLPDDIFENGGCGVAECKRLSFTFSDTSGSSPSPAQSSFSQSQSNPEITVTPPDTDSLPTPILQTREDSIAEEHLKQDIFEFICNCKKKENPEMLFTNHMLNLSFHLSKEGFAEALCSGDHSRCLAQLEEVAWSTLWPRSSTLRALASLLTSEEPQVNKAASDYLSSAASDRHFRARAVEYYTQALSEAGVQSQRAACSALSCLQAVESLKAVIALCDSADEELRHVAIETLLTFGEEGRLAYEQLDTVVGNMIRLGTRRGNAVTTAF